MEIFKPGEEKIHKIFLDPTGRHLIISLVSTENLYLSRNSKKAKPVGKLKVGIVAFALSCPYCLTWKVCMCMRLYVCIDFCS